MITLLSILAVPLIARAQTHEMETGLVHTGPVELVALEAKTGVPLPEPPKEEPTYHKEPPVPVDCGMRPGSWPEVQRMVEDEFGFGHIMVEVARAESRFDPDARNCSSTATGVFQILIGTWNGYQCTGERTNARDNIDCARKIYDARGTKDWDASKYAWGAML